MTRPTPTCRATRVTHFEIERGAAGARRCSACGWRPAARTRSARTCRRSATRSCGDPVYGTPGALGPRAPVPARGAAGLRASRHRRARRRALAAARRTSRGARRARAERDVATLAFSRHFYPSGPATAALPGASRRAGSAELARAASAHITKGAAPWPTRGRHPRAAGGRRPLRPPDAPLEPQDAPLHPRRARRDLHHRPAPDARRCSSRRSEFAVELAHRGGTVLFVGTKKQARDAIKEVAERAGMPYVNHRWLGGLLTNFQTISQRIKRLHDLERYETEGQLELLPTRERMAAAGRPRQAAGQPRRRQEHAAPAGRDVRDRPQDRGDRRARGPAPAHPDHRPGRHQLRPRRDRLRDPRQRRRDPLLRADHRRRSATSSPRATRVFRAEEERRAPGGRGEGPPRGRGARSARGRGAGQRSEAEERAAASRAGEAAERPEPAARRPPRPAPRPPAEAPAAGSRPRRPHRRAAARGAAAAPRPPSRGARPAAERRGARRGPSRPRETRRRMTTITASGRQGAARPHRRRA